MYSPQGVFRTIRENSGQLGALETHLRQSMQLSLDVASEILERNQDGTKIDDKLSKLQNLMSGYVQLEHDVVQFRAAVEDMCNNKTDIPENCADLLRDSYRTLRASASEPESHTSYKELMRIIEDGQDDGESVVPQTQEEDEDGEVVLTQQDDSIPVDPFTRREVTDPVRNKICKHVYEKASILQHMNSRGRNVRCPISGCSNAVRITEDLLEDHEELRRQIRRKKRAVNLFLPT